MTAPGVRMSVVVPFYNAERFIASCIEGLLAQSLPRDAYEIILVDNNSTDSSCTIAGSYDGITLLKEGVAGSYNARNTGIRASNGAIIATLDPDCRPDPGWLSAIEAAMTDPACCIVLGHQSHANGSVPLKLLEMYEAEKIAFVTRRKEKKAYFGYTNNMAFRRTLFDSVGMFPDRTRGGDTIFVRSVVDRLGCEAVTFSPEMRITHLEVDTLGAYYNKRLIYGQSNERITKVTSFRHLRNSERLAVFRDLARKQRFPLGKKLLLLALLAPGALLYELGRRRSAVNRA